MSSADLRAGIVQLGADLYRLKGFLDTEEGLQYVDYAGRGLQVRPADGPADPGIVVIARGAARHRVQQWLDRVCRPPAPASSAPGGRLEQIRGP